MSADPVDPCDLAGLHDELRAVVRRLAGHPPSALGGAAPPALDWGALAAAGLLGLEVPDALGGAGANFAEVAVVLDELGRSPATGPYLGTAVLGVGALTLTEAGHRRDELLRAAAAGQVALAVVLDPGPAVPGPPTFRLAGPPDRPVLQGLAALVPDTPGADVLLVPAADHREGGSRPGDGAPVVVVAAPPARGLVVEERAVLDATRRLATVAADDVPVDPGAVLVFGTDPEAAVARLHDRAATAVACDSLGLAGAMLDATVAYAGTREQFGRPIGSFQAVQHACADMLVAVTVSRGLVADAVAAVAAAAAGGPQATVGRMVAMAKAHACAVGVDVAGTAVQLHGGVGYAWESGLHAYLKRAACNRALFGPPAAHRRRLAGNYPAAAGRGGGH